MRRWDEQFNLLALGASASKGPRGTHKSGRPPARARQKKCSPRESHCFLQQVVAGEKFVARRQRASLLVPRVSLALHAAPHKIGHQSDGKHTRAPQNLVRGAICATQLGADESAPCLKNACADFNHPANTTLSGRRHAHAGEPKARRSGRA